MMIRSMCIEDYEAIKQLWLTTSGMGLNDVDDSYEGISRYLKRNPTTSFVAEVDGKIIGSILCGHDGRRGFIYHTTVKKQFQHQGIARSLVSYAMNALKQAGISKVALVAFTNNVDGNSFWESIGFTVRDDLSYRNKALQELSIIIPK